MGGVEIGGADHRPWREDADAVLRPLPSRSLSTRRRMRLWVAEILRRIDVTWRGMLDRYLVHPLGMRGDEQPGAAVAPQVAGLRIDLS